MNSAIATIAKPAPVWIRLSSSRIDRASQPKWLAAPAIEEAPNMPAMIRSWLTASFQTMKPIERVYCAMRPAGPST